MICTLNLKIIDKVSINILVLLRKKKGGGEIGIAVEELSHKDNSSYVISIIILGCVKMERKIRRNIIRKVTGNGNLKEAWAKYQEAKYDWRYKIICIKNGCFK